MLAEHVLRRRGAATPLTQSYGPTDSAGKTLMPGKTEAGGQGETEEEVVGWHH